MNQGPNEIKTSADTPTVQSPATNQTNLEVQDFDWLDVHLDQILEMLPDITSYTSAYEVPWNDIPSSPPLPLNTPPDPTRSVDGRNNSVTMPSEVLQLVKQLIRDEENMQPDHLNSQSCDHSKGKESTDTQTAVANRYPPTAPPQYIQGQGFTNTQTAVANSYHPAPPLQYAQCQGFPNTQTAVANSYHPAQPLQYAQGQEFSNTKTAVANSYHHGPPLQYAQGQGFTNTQTAVVNRYPPAAPLQYVQGQWSTNTRTAVVNSYPPAAPLHYVQGQWSTNTQTAEVNSYPPAAPLQYAQTQWSTNTQTAVANSYPPAAPLQYAQGLGYTHPQTAEANHYPPSAHPQYAQVQGFTNNQTAVAIRYPPAAPLQYTPGHQFVENASTAMTFTYPPAASQQTDVDIPVLENVFGQSIQYAGFYNGPIYKLESVLEPAVAAAPPADISNVKGKRRMKRNVDEGKPYVKKPRNAFMLFLAERRPYVDPDIIRLGSGAVNACLGSQWKMLQQEVKNAFHLQAEKEKDLHQELFPDWSARENYGKKRKRQRRKCPTVKVEDFQEW